MERKAHTVLGGVPTQLSTTMYLICPGWEIPRLDSEEMGNWKTILNYPCHYQLDTHLHQHGCAALNFTVCPSVSNACYKFTLQTRAMLEAWHRLALEQVLGIQTRTYKDLAWDSYKMTSMDLGHALHALLQDQPVFALGAALDTAMEPAGTHEEKRDAGRSQWSTCRGGGGKPKSKESTLQDSRSSEVLGWQGPPEMVWSNPCS